MNKDEIIVNVIDREGNTHILNAPIDISLNLMEVCRMYELPVEGRCGGMAMCATCQCYVESSTNLPDLSEAEAAMLDEAFFVKSNSRLGCQIPVTPIINGIVVRLAPEGN